MYNYQLNVPQSARISWNTLNEIPKKYRSNQESMFLATFEHNTYFIDLSFYDGEKPYRLEVWRSLGDADYNKVDYWGKRYAEEAETHADLDYWLKVMEAYTQPLPEGIAGFNTLPKFEKRDTAKEIIAVLSAYGYTHKATNDVYPNAYLELNFEKDDKIYCIELNNIHPWFSLSPMTFDELYALLPLILPFGIFCNDGFLNKPLSPNSIGLLNKFEQKQVKRWKPKTVGEIVFNQWD
ncbi:MAG: hypothetical protein U5L45_18370 [Saprospiraceae bacterium]|nr:hypothetical protein [Saprospiraceae bacterium]